MDFKGFMKCPNLCCTRLYHTRLSLTSIAKATHIFATKISIYMCLKNNLATTVNKFFINVFIKLMMLWTTGPKSFCHTYLSKQGQYRCPVFHSSVYPSVRTAMFVTTLKFKSFSEQLLHLQSSYKAYTFSERKIQSVWHQLWPWPIFHVQMTAIFMSSK